MSTSSSKYRNTIILLVVFIALLLFVYFFIKDKEVPIEDEVVMHDVIEISKDEVKEVIFQYEGEKTKVVKEGDEWNLVEPIKFKARATKIESVIDELNNLQAETKFESDDLREYGLDNPKHTVTFINNNGEEKTVSFGDLNLQETLVYLAISDDNNIYMVEKMIQTRLMLNDENLKED